MINPKHFCDCVKEVYCDFNPCETCNEQPCEC